MITKVELENFQAHRKLSLDLGPFTVCSGPSNSGKSAVLRAIVALLRNDPVADYVSHGQSDLKVALHLSDGHTVTWAKGKTKNEYELRRPDGTKTAFKKVGTDVPDEVRDVLRMSPIQLEDKTKAHLNVHEQQDPPFLVTSSAPYVAKVFGELTSAGKLFSAANEGNRRVKEYKKIQNLRQADADSLTKDLESFASLDETESALQAVDTVLQSIYQVENAVMSLSGLEETLNEVIAGAESSAELIAQLEPVISVDIDTITKLNLAIREVGARLAELTAINVSLAQVEDAIASLEPVTVDLDGLEAVALNVKSIIEIRSQLYSVTKSIDALQDTSSEVDLNSIDVDLLAKLNNSLVRAKEYLDQNLEIDFQIRNQEQIISRANEVLTEVEQQLSEISSCPTCGQELTDDAREHLGGHNA